MTTDAPWADFTPNDWRCARPVPVVVATLTGLRPVVWRDGFEGRKHADLIHVVRWGGLLYIEDGHYRVARARRAGVGLVWCRVLVGRRVRG